MKFVEFVNSVRESAQFFLPGRFYKFEFIKFPGFLKDALLDKLVLLREFVLSIFFFLFLLRIVFNDFI